MEMKPNIEVSKIDHNSTEQVVNKAKQIFRFNGWSSETLDIQTDFVDVDLTTKRVSLRVSAILRVALAGGSFHGAIQHFGASTKQHVPEPSSSKDNQMM
ncbi:hypothetical protein DM02DRAFT_664798 [Periconia macrospinosa]|uniref:Uncharacterized protein n=1 Tax=Periconia macrospinosa TaxID=97972 RepID=A0A2V1D0A6_9PLEO|nr:hypothetical protein DM02DRAFT_664798 [Periconia macrospinosa]